MVTRYTASYNDYYDDNDGVFVTYQDYAALEVRLLALLDHPVLKAHTEALREAQITGLAFIRVNANCHVQVLPSDRVQLSVIQAVEEQESRARGCDHPRRLIWEMDNQVCEACDICHTVRIRAVK